MIWIAVWCCVALTSPTVVSFENTELYVDHLSRADIAVSASGEVFLVDQQEHRILRYSADGRRLGQIGRRGQGPEEFEKIVRIWHQNDQLWVDNAGSNSVKSFTPKGVLVKEWSLPAQHLRILKVADGWLAASFVSWSADHQPKILFYDPAFKQERTLLELPAMDNTHSTKADSDKHVWVYNPVSSRLMFAGHPNHRFVFVKQSDSFHISVIDGHLGKVVRTIQRNEPRIPFNEAFGRKRMAEVEENIQKQGQLAQKISLKSDFPDFFPVIRDMEVNNDGLLVIRKWTSNPDQEEAFLILDEHGKERSLGYPHHLVHRVIAEQGDDVYLTASGKADDEIVVLSCRRDQAEQVATAFPLHRED